MKKMQVLHDYLLSTGLVKPEQVNTTVTEGKVVFYGAGEPSSAIAFSREYTVQVLINAWGGDADKLDAAIVWWCCLYQPELVGREHGYGFEAEVINSETINLCILLPLTETARYDSTSGEMLNCVKPLILNDASLADVPAFLLDTTTGEETPLTEETPDV